MSTVSSQQDWPAQIRSASSTKVHSLLACVRATLPHNTQEENLCSQGSWRNRDVKLSRAKQRCFQGWIVFFTQCQMSVIFCAVCWDIKNHLTVSLLGKILKPQLLQVMKLNAFMKLFVQATPAKRSDMNRMADTSKESPGKKLNLGYAAIRQGEKIII